MSLYLKSVCKKIKCLTHFTAGTTFKDLLCSCCSQPYTTSANCIEDRRPHKFGCSNPDVFCGKCCSQLKICPVCKKRPNGPPILENMNVLKEKWNSMENNLPKISDKEITFLSKDPKFHGTFADIYH